MQPYLKTCARLIELDGKLPAILKGEAQPANAGEKAFLGQLCLAKKLFVAATRFYQEAFREQPALAADLQSARRYNAARAAAQAGAGQGKDQSMVAQEERALLRKQALQWLRADLVLFEQTSKTPAGRALAVKKLLLWQRSPDFAGLRDEAGLAKLPAAEQAECRGLWADVEALLARLKPMARQVQPERR
jgi:hypothetical protein